MQAPSASGTVSKGETSTSHAGTVWGTFRLRDDDETCEIILERETDKGWFALYGFDRSPVTQSEIDEANIACAMGEMSPFPRHLMMYRARPDGRASLFNLRFRLERAGVAQERDLQTPADLSAVLRDVFGLPANGTRDTALWAKLSVPEHATAP